MLAGCSENTSNAKIHLQKKREEFVEKRKQANEKAVKEAAQKKRTEEKQRELNDIIKTGGTKALEEKTITAFENYKKKAADLAKKKTITEIDRIELERARNAFDAIKKAKREVLKKESVKKMTENLKQG